MPIRLISVNAAFCIALLASSASAVAEQSSQPDAQGDQPVFIPPKIGVPADRLGAGTRDVSGATDALLLLVPEGGGLTSSGAPPLVWRLSRNFAGTVTTQISALDATGVVLEWNAPLPKGYYALDLRRSDFRLKEGVIYAWKVTLTNGTSTVAFAESLVERVPETNDDPGQAGIWFDALSPLVSVDLSGRVRVSDTDALSKLLDAGGVIR